MDKLRSLLLACRLPFLTATLIPVAYGAALAFYQGVFTIGLFFWTALGSMFLHTGTNLINNYFDYYNGSDVNNTERTQFNGGTDVIVAGKVKPWEIALLSFAFYSIGGGIGLYLAYLRGVVVMYLGLVGIVLSYFYSAPPIQLINRGFGELTVGLCFGPLLVVGSYYVQTQSYDPRVFQLGIPVGLLIAAVLYVNQFPDYKADKDAEKNNWVVRLGKSQAVKGYYFLVVLAYTIIGIQVRLQLIPPTALLSLVTVPLAIKAFLVIRDNYEQTEGMIPCMATTIQVHFLTGSLLVASLILAQIFKL